MTDEALLQLALRALDDREARQVLGDVVLETGWSDWRVTRLMKLSRWQLARWSYGSWPLPWSAKVRSHLRECNLSRKHARNPTRRWCRAVVAVLLFCGWQESIWETPKRCRRPAPRSEDTARVLRALYLQSSLSESIFAQSPFLSMLPRGASPSQIILSPQNYEALKKELAPKATQPIQPMGFTGVEIAGPQGAIRVVADPNVPANHPGYFIDTNSKSLVDIWEGEIRDREHTARRLLGQFFYGTGTDACRRNSTR